MHDVRRKRWGEMLDSAAADVAHYTRLGAKGRLSQVLPYRDAMLAVRAERKRTRRDYFTKDDAARVSALAYPELAN